MKTHQTGLKLLSLCITLLLVFTSLSFAENEKYLLSINIIFDSNIIFSRYNVRLKLDGTQLALMKHGENFSGNRMVSPGDHVITFHKEDNDKVTGRAEVHVDSQTKFSCNIHVNRNEIEVTNIKVDSDPSGGKNASRTSLKTFNYGRYEQDEKSDNGREPIEWYIAEEKDGKMLLISKKALDCKPFHSIQGNVTWGQSSIRQWLNGPFIHSAFTPEEQEAIQISTIENQQSSSGDWNKSEAASTKDKVFLLSYNEYMKYLVHDEEKMIQTTEYAKKQGTASRIWLRTPGRTRGEMQCYLDGSFESDSTTKTNALRPAMWIDTSIAQEKSSYVIYQKAVTLSNQGKYEEAAIVFEGLNGYNGSSSLAMECRYQQAQQYLKARDYQSAIDILMNMTDYKDSAALVLDCRYTIAIDLEQKGDYAAALERFKGIGQYKQTMDHVRNCYEKLRIQYSWLTKKIGDTVNAGHDTGFSKEDGIKDNDPHFGWSLGSFMIGEYTEVKEGGKHPVFIKTPGDSVTLWFDLTQDIDKLNDNKDLRINRDTNGKDQNFQYPQSDFGRGALLVRHIDFRGSDSNVQIYTDFLAAKNGSGANTSIQLNEEGIYEVALDYEIEKKGIIPSYNDYRLFTTFEIRNGSGMFFLFDVETGSELQDYSRTPNGFRIDLANSHSLSVKYTRYAMNQEETGLDVRKSEPASDGDTFEKIGYYVITVTNKETNEQVTKHIFVGRAADLEEYQAVDKSLDGFSNN